MTQDIRLYCLRASVSLAFKTSLGGDYGDFERPFGAGFNAQIEIAWNWTEGGEKDRQPLIESAFSQFIKKIDHRHLGLDAPELKITTPESLLKFADEYFSEKKLPCKSIRLWRGEDIQYRLEL
jgi:hypothetical protein